MFQPKHVELLAGNKILYKKSAILLEHFYELLFIFSRKLSPSSVFQQTEVQIVPLLVLLSSENIVDKHRQIGLTFQ
jgi:hypothetical protein